MSACGGFLFSWKSVARGALHPFMPKHTPFPTKKFFHCGAAPIGLYGVNNYECAEDM